MSECEDISVLVTFALLVKPAIWEFHVNFQFALKSVNFDVNTQTLNQASRSNVKLHKN